MFKFAFQCDDGKDDIDNYDDVNDDVDEPDMLTDTSLNIYSSIQVARISLP